MPALWIREVRMKLLILLLLLLLLPSTAYAPAPDRDYWHEWRVKTAMAYHGIWYAECIGHDCWFERDGQRCNLFTDAFERRWEERSECGRWERAEAKKVEG